MIGFTPATEPAAWRAALAGLPAAFGHQPEFAQATARALGREAWLWTRDDDGARAACPVLLARDSKGADLATPLGFSGLVASPHSEAQAQALARAWTDDWRARGVLAAYVQCAPWTERAIEQGWTALGADLRDGPDCLCWDLRPSPDALLAGMSSKHRQLVRKWLREDARPEHDQGRLLDSFRVLYPAFAARAGVAAAYRLDRAAIDALASAPGAFFVGARGMAGDIEAVTLFGAGGARGESVLSAATPEGRRHSRGLYWLGALALRERGAETMVLGGGIAPGDGVGEFKQRLGAVAVPSRVLRQVFDAEGFARACARAGGDPEARFFPPWRAPAG